MKSSFFKTSLLALGAIFALVACNPEKEKINVSLGASSSEFNAGKVDLSVTLSAKSSAEVTATITADGSIPASALSFNGSVTVPAGETSAKVPVTVDADGLAPGNYDVTFTLASVTGGQPDASASSAKVSLVVAKPAEPEPPVVSIASYDDSFTDNVAKLTLALSAVAAKDITVKFATSAVEGYTEIPADALSFDNPVTIPAGSASKEMTITLDPDKLPNGECWVMLSIESVSDNAKLGTDKSAYLTATGVTKAVLVPEWSLSYAGRAESTQGNMLDWILVENWTGEFYDIAVYHGGTLESVEGDVSVIMSARHESFVGRYLGTYTIEQLLRNEPSYCGFGPLDPGSYECYLFDYTSDGTMTGKYTMLEFLVEEEEATEEYNALLGIYTISSKGIHAEYNDGWTYPDSEVNKEAVYVMPNVNNMSYVVYLPEWDEDDQKNYYYPFIMDWDRNTGAISGSTQMLEEWDHSSYGKVEDWQLGYIVYNGQTSSVTGSYTIFESEGFKDGAFVLNAGPSLTLSGGGEYDIAGLDLVGALVEYEGGKYSFIYLQVPFPATFTRVADLPADEGESVTSNVVRPASFVRPQTAALRSVSGNDSGKVPFNPFLKAVKR